MLSSVPQSTLRLFTYRWLVYELVARDLRLRYRGSLLGVAWTLLNPLFFMGIYTLVFSVYLRISIAHYPLFLLSGLVPWTWLASSMQQGVTAILDGRAYVGKTTFPTLALLAVPVLSNAVNFVFSIPILIVLALLSGVKPGLSLLALPLLFVIQAAITFALVQLVATLNVFLRDLQQLITYVMTMLFYLTPIFYTVDQVPARFSWLLSFNPFAALMQGYQAIFYRHAFPSAGDLLFSAVTALVLLAIAQGTYLRNCESFGQYV